MADANLEDERHGNFRDCINEVFVTGVLCTFMAEIMQYCKVRCSRG